MYCVFCSEIYHCFDISGSVDWYKSMLWYSMCSCRVCMLTIASIMMKDNTHGGIYNYIHFIYQRI